MLVYNIERNVEYRYLDVFAATESLEHPLPMEPYVSANTMPGEDMTTPRICVAASIEECVMGCTLFAFRRCCSRVRGMEKYAGLPYEAYPIIVNTFDVDAPYVPSPNEVPDAPDTGELWLKEPTTPLRRQMFWLTPNAIEAYGPEYYPGEVWPEWEDFHVVEHVSLLTTEEALENGLAHPWLNRRGHCLGDTNNLSIVWGPELHCLGDGWREIA